MAVLTNDGEGNKPADAQGQPFDQMLLLKRMVGYTVGDPTKTLIKNRCSNMRSICQAGTDKVILAWLFNNSYHE